MVSSAFVASLGLEERVRLVPQDTRVAPVGSASIGQVPLAQAPIGGREMGGAANPEAAGSQAEDSGQGRTDG